MTSGHTSGWTPELIKLINITHRNYLHHWLILTPLGISELIHQWPGSWLGWDDGWLPIKYNAIISTNVDLLAIEPLKTNQSNISIHNKNKIYFEKMCLKMPSAAILPTVLKLSLLSINHGTTIKTGSHLHIRWCQTASSVVSWGSLYLEIYGIHIEMGPGSDTVKLVLKVLTSLDKKWPFAMSSLPFCEKRVKSFNLDVISERCSLWRLIMASAPATSLASSSAVIRANISLHQALRNRSKNQ